MKPSVPISESLSDDSSVSINLGPSDNAPSSVRGGSMKSLSRLVTTILLGFAMCGPAGAQYSSEAGFGILQQNCMTCHGQASAPRAPSVGALRELSPEKIYEVLNTT